MSDFDSGWAPIDSTQADLARFALRDWAARDLSLLTRAKMADVQGYTGIYMKRLNAGLRLNRPASALVQRSRPRETLVCIDLCSSRRLVRCFGSSKVLMTICRS